MKTHRLVIVSLLACLLSLPLQAEEKSLSDGLRDALYLEEVKRDPAAAASAYESLLDGYEQQQQLAATALFRLAEIRRAEGRKDEAIALYQRLIAQFPNADTKLARENLLALGAKMPEAAKVFDEEEVELQKLQAMLQESPDQFAKLDFSSYAKENKRKIVTWMIQEAGVNIDGKELLVTAAMCGHKTMIELLVKLEPEKCKKEFPKAMKQACTYGNVEVVKSLLHAGADPNVGVEIASMNGRSISNGKPLVVALTYRQYAVADELLKCGADPSASEGPQGITPLLAIVLTRQAPGYRTKMEELEAGTISYVKKLLSAGADINALYTETEYSSTGNTPITYQRNLLSFAVQYGMVDVCKLLIQNKIKVSDSNQFRFLLRSRGNGSMSELNDQNDLWRCITLLLEAGYDPNLKIDNRVSLVAYFYADRNIKMAKLFIEKGAKIEDVEPYEIKSNGRTRSFVPPNASAMRTQDASVKITGKLMLTQQAAVDKEPDFLALFLKAGGKLETVELSITYFLSKEWMIYENTVDTKELACVKIFVEQGIEPEKEWRNSGYSLAPESIKAFLNERFPAEKPKAEEKPKEDTSR